MAITMKDLARKLAAQAAPAPHRITIDDGTLGRSDVDALIASSLGRDNLILAVDPAKIPTDPPDAGFDLPVTLPISQQDSFLRLTGKDCTIRFVMNGGVIDLQLLIDPYSERGAKVRWSFGVSFAVPAVRFDKLPLDGLRLVFSTYHIPGGTGTSCADVIPEGILPGLNVTAELTLDGLLADVARLITGGQSLPAGEADGSLVPTPPAVVGTSYRLFGHATRSVDGISLELGACLNVPSLKLGFLQISQLYIGAGLTYVDSKDEGSGDPPMKQAVANIYVGARIIVHGNGADLPLDIRTFVANKKGRPSMTFVLTPPRGFITSIKDIGSLVDKNRWDEFFTKDASVLEPYVSTFGLKGFFASVSLNKGLSINSIGLQAGISKPWSFFDGLLTLNAFDVSWMVIAPTSNTPIQTATISAQLQLFNDPNIIADIDVTLPGLVISGAYPGTIRFSSLVKKVAAFFEVTLPNPPEDIADFAFSNLAVMIDVPNKSFMLSGSADFHLRLFGLELLGLHDAQFMVAVDRKKDAKIPFAASITGVLTVLDVDFAVTASYGETIEFEIHMVDMTVGKLLNFLVHLVDPTYDVKFDAPWDAILAIDLSALVFRVSYGKTARTVSLSYESTITLAFVTITELGIAYTKKGKAAGKVEIQISGAFLGVTFGKGSPNPALKWDPMNEAPPAVPGKGGSLFDLQYLGLGQRIAITGKDPKTIKDVMAILRESVIPSQPGELPPLGQKGLAFRRDSNWLIGAQFTVMDTVSISAIFNDPNLYGILIALSGEKARSFAGLSFEILYRKISDTLGVYHIELKLPDSMRRLELGAASLTLPLIKLDIYTNGNFRVDLGFPKGLDFSNSFGLQVFPFVGAGGFYFAMLDGSTSTQVPKITNGTFSPVLEFGFALQIGVGKTISYGILSGGITVTVTGILQGVLGWFNPTDSSPKEVYYRLQGTIAITGRLYGSIDFGVIKASVDVTAYASMTLTMEAHRQMYIAINAGVSVSVSVKVVFVTLHFSFSATIEASFVIGSNSGTPWRLAAGSGDTMLRSARGTRMFAATLSLHAALGLSVDAPLQLSVSVGPITRWPVVSVFGKVVPVDVLVLPSFTKGDAWRIPESGGARRNDGVTTVTTATPHDFLAGDTVYIAGVADGSFNGTFTVESSPNETTFTYRQPSAVGAVSGGGTAGATPPGASTVMMLAVHSDQARETAAPASLEDLIGDDGVAFNILMSQMLLWAIYAEVERSGLAWTIASSTATPPGVVRKLSYTTVTTTAPNNARIGMRVAVVGVDDMSFNGTFLVDQVLSATSFTYFQGGAPDAESGGGTAGPALVTLEQLDDVRQSLTMPETLAALDYETLTAFIEKNLRLRLVPPASVTRETGMGVFPMIPPLQFADSTGRSIYFDDSTAGGLDPTYVPKMRAYFELLSVRYDSANRGKRAEEAAPAAGSVPISRIVFSQYFSMLISSAVRNALDMMESYPVVTGGVWGISEVAGSIGDAALPHEPMRIVAPNRDEPVFQTGSQIWLPEVDYRIRQGDTFVSVAARLAADGARDSSGAAYSAAELLFINGGTRGILTPGTAVTFTGIVYVTDPTDTLNLIASRAILRTVKASFITSIPDLGPAVDRMSASNPSITDPNAPLTVPTLTLPQPWSGAYRVVPGDTLTLAAAYFQAIERRSVDLYSFIVELRKLNPGGLPDDPSAPIGTDVAVHIPPLTRKVQDTDTIDSLATAMITAADVVHASLLAVPASVQILALHGVLSTPLTYRLGPDDTFSGIASRFGITLEELARRAAGVSRLFAAGRTLTVANVSAVNYMDLVLRLCGENWKDAAGMISRFFLSGLRVPDPHDPTFAAMSIADFADPTKLADIRTKPLFSLTRQQFPIGGSAPSDYRMSFTNRGGVSWVAAGDSGKLEFGLTADQQKLLQTVATTALDPDVRKPIRLPLYRMVPPRVALRSHIEWKPASAAEVASPTAGAPSIWIFPDPLVEQVKQTADRSPDDVLLYDLVASRHFDGAVATADHLSSWMWGTIVDLSVSIPKTDGADMSLADGFVIDGTDDTGAELLEQVYNHITSGGGARLHILYSPDPTSSSPGGLVSGAADPAATFAMKTNLSTVTHSGLRLALAKLTVDPESLYAAKLSDPVAFLLLLWEASVTRNGGFYLNYAEAGGATFPASIFAGGNSATISLLILLDGQLPGTGAGLLPFNNCAVVGDVVDPASTSLVVQPATYVARDGDSLTTAAASFNETWKTSFTPQHIAVFNADVQLLLRVGAALTMPGSGAQHLIAPGETLASIAAAAGTDVTALVNAGSNATAPVIDRGAQMQFAHGILYPVSTAPPGTIGYELTRTNPDPDDLAYGRLTPKQIVGSLFNLVGFALGRSTAFLPSGAGLPTTPAESWQASSDGFRLSAPPAGPSPSWYYHQTLSAAPFSRGHYGSRSAALPPAASNPYGGVGFDTGAGSVNRATIVLDMQDVYGNIQPLPDGFDSLAVPVGYTDEITRLAGWPAAAFSYTVTGTPPTIVIGPTIEQSRYIPSASVPAVTALATAAADLESYRRIYYQIAQPDLSFGLRTTLDATSMSATAPVYPLRKSFFSSIVDGMCVYFSTLGAMTPTMTGVSGDKRTIRDVAMGHMVEPRPLLAANADALYSSLFGATVLRVPIVYTTIEGDSLTSIAARFTSSGATPATIAALNANVPLDPGVDLVARQRTMQAAASDSLADLAARAHASIAGIAAANATSTAILRTGAVLTVSIGGSHTVAQGDSIASIAAELGTSVADLATANGWIEGIFTGGVSITVADVAASKGDTLALLAKLVGGSVDALAAANPGVGNIFAPGTQLIVGNNASPIPAGPADTLATFALANHVTIDLLADANAATPFAEGATLAIPNLLTFQTKRGIYGSYTAADTDTLGSIAAKFGTDAKGIGAFNADRPGLLVAGQKITHAASDTSVTTIDEDTLVAIIDRFAAQGVTLDLPGLATIIQGQPGLVARGRLWLAPPMSGNAGGTNTDGSFAGLARAYNVDPVVLATTNAATAPMFASGVKLSVLGVEIVANGWTSFNGIVSVLAMNGIAATLADVVDAISAMEGAIDPKATLIPAPPSVSPLEVAIARPKLADAIVPITVNVVASRDPRWIDPEFAATPGVGLATSTIPPQADPDGAEGDAPLALKGIAKALETSLPGLHIAVGDPAAEKDPESASTLWGVNFGNPAGPVMTYRFDGASAEYFAIPPMVTSPMEGTVSITPYVPGTGLVGTPVLRTFQSTDLDDWLRTFLDAVDLFLSPSYAIPAFAIDPAEPAAKAVVNVIARKKKLAHLIASRLVPVLQGGTGGALADAIDAMEQGMLEKLSSAYTVDTVVQVPVSITSAASGPAPRLAGKIVIEDPDAGPADGAPDAFSFSTTKVEMKTASSNATFLFSVKAPASYREASLDLRCEIDELERPDPDALIAGYQGSTWLKFIRPLDRVPSTIGRVDIPIPLRSYPSPVTLVSQRAWQSVQAPKTAADLSSWDYDLVYQHNEAQQDTPLVSVTFNGTPDTQFPRAASSGGLDLVSIFEALAQFVSVWSDLKVDLGKLPLLSPGASSAEALTAVKAFSTLVAQVADAWKPSPSRLGFTPPKKIYNYQMQKGVTQTNPATLTTLTLSAVDPATGQPKPNPTMLWPDVYATVKGVEMKLTPAGSPTATQAVYAYPPDIPAATVLPQRFHFNAGADSVFSGTPEPSDVTLVAPQRFEFAGLDILEDQSGIAGVSITRNSVLITGRTTNPAFIYQTPLTKFTTMAIPEVFAGSDIRIGGGSPTEVGAALGAFLKDVLQGGRSWQPSDRISIRFAAAYAYVLATAGEEVLSPRVPIVLIPAYDFDPGTDWNVAAQTSFVKQIESLVAGWFNANQPSVKGGSYLFDLTVFSATAGLQPMIRATSLRYMLE